MKTYRVTSGQATFSIGMVLKLTDKQSRARQYALTSKGKDTFVVTYPVQFKQGEIITLVKGELSRLLSHCLTAVDASKATLKSTPTQTAKPVTAKTAAKTVSLDKADGL